MPTTLRYTALLVIILSWLGATAQPVANFTFTLPTVKCPPLIVQFTNQSTGATSYQWTFNGPGGSSNQTSPGWTFLAPGTHTVTLTANGPGGSSTVSKTVTVSDTPVVNFSSVTPTVCPGSAIQFSDQTVTGGNPSTYSWTFPNGTPGSSTSQNPSVVYTTGPNNVTLTVTNSFQCTRSVTKVAYANVHPKPTANFTANTQVFCEGTSPVPYTATFNGTGTGGTPGPAPGYSFNWLFGVTPASGQSVSQTFAGPAPQSYTVKLTVTDSKGCTGVEEKTGFININKVTASSSGPASVCAGVPFTFNNTSGSGTSAIWDIPGVFTGASIATLNYTIYTPGTYKVKLTASGPGGCADTVVKNLVVHPKPIFDFTATPVAPCPAPQTIQFNATGNATSYAWDFGTPAPGNTGTGASPTHTYHTNNDFTVKLVGTNAFGCKDTVEKIGEIRLFDLWISTNQDKKGDCLPAKIHFATSLNTRSGVKNYPYTAGTIYTWDFGEFPPATITTDKDTITYTYTTMGTFRVIVKAQTPNGCIVYDTMEVKTGPKPTAQFVASPLVQCAGQPIQFTDQSLNALQWEWHFGNGPQFKPGTSIQKNPVYVYDSPGVFTVTLVAVNNECRDTMKKIGYIQIKPPYAKFDSLFHCDDRKKVTFLNRSDTATSFIWSFNHPTGTFTSTQESPTFTYPSLGTYTVRLIAINTERGCRDTIFHQINLYDPAVSFTTGRPAICLNDTTSLNPIITGGPIKNILWYVNNFMSPIQPHKFVTRGQQKIKLLIEDTHGCLDSSVVNNALLVSRPQTAFVGSPLVGCVPLPVNFTDQSTVPTGATIIWREWDFGNGNPPIKIPGATTSAVYGARGKYDVRLITTDNIGCSDTLKKGAYIEAKKPIADFGAPVQNSCIGTPLYFNSSSTDATTYTWDFGDGGSSKLEDDTHTYASTGAYTIRLIVADDNNCTDTMTKTSFIKITKPTAGLTMDDSFSVCPPLTVNFKDNSINATSYEWRTVISPAPITTKNATDVYYRSGKFQVLHIVKDANGCPDTAKATVDVLGYDGALTYTPLKGCAPLQVDFTSLVNNVAQITWDFSDGTITQGTGPNISHTYTTPGAYIPKLVISDGSGCTAGSLGLDTIKVDGILLDFDYGPACIGTPVSFVDKSRGAFSDIQSRRWTFHTGNVFTTSTAYNTYQDPGQYKVWLKATNKNGCADSTEELITINGLPKISAGGDTTICLKDFVQLAGTGGVSYKWSPASTLDCSDCPNPKAAPQARTTYTVIGTDANSCSDTDKVEIDIKTKVVANVGQGGEICQDEKFLLSVDGGRTQQWFPGESLNDNTIKTPSAGPQQTTTYRVVSYEGSCIPDTNDVKVIVHPKPTVKASGAQTIISGNPATIYAEGERIHRFAWAPYENMTCSDCPDPRVTPSKTTTYTVTVFTDKNCADSDQVTITVLCDQSQVFIPNTFTPNGDGQNDVFYPRANGLEMVNAIRIYNRWGEVVFQRTNFPFNNTAYAWDGTYKGQVLPPDVYVYIVEATCSNGELFQWKGDISILR